MVVPSAESSDLGCHRCPCIYISSLWWFLITYITCITFVYIVYIRFMVGASSYWRIVLDNHQHSFPNWTIEACQNSREVCKPSYLISDNTRIRARIAQVIPLVSFFGHFHYQLGKTHPRANTCALVLNSVLFHRKITKINSAPMEVTHGLLNEMFHGNIKRDSNINWMEIELQYIAISTRDIMRYTGDINTPWRYLELCCHDFCCQNRQHGA